MDEQKLNEYENGTSALGLHFLFVAWPEKQTYTYNNCSKGLSHPGLCFNRKMQKGCRNYLLLLGREIEGERCVAGDQGQKLKSPKKFRSVLRRWTEWTEELMNVENQRLQRKGEARAATKCGKVIGPNYIPVEVFGINIA